MNKTYELVTETILEALEAGIVPWHQPWIVHEPCNATTKRPYSGCNWFILGYLQHKNGFNSHRWLTFKQALDAGGNVKKGEKGSIVVYADRFKKVETNSSGDTVERNIPFLKSFVVFNENQVEGCKLPELENINPDLDGDDLADNVWLGYKQRPEIVLSDIAAYRVTDDKILMPQRSAFESNEAFYSVLFHEAIHSTGSEHRLNRAELRKNASAAFSKEDYSKEELVAECGSAFLMASCSLPVNVPQTSSYIHGWLKALKHDKTLFVSAASRAQKASDYILGKGAN